MHRALGRLAGWVLLASAGLAACASAPPAEHATATTGPALTVDTLGAALANKTTLVVFMTAWCEMCRHEAPALVAWAQRHRADVPPIGVLVLMSGSPATEVPRLVRERQLEGLPVYADSDGAIADHFRVAQTPTLFLFEGSLERSGRAFHSLSELPDPPVAPAR